MDFLIWTLLLVITLILGALGSVSLLHWRNRKINIVTLLGPCTPEVSSLPDVSDLQCCVEGGSITASKYFPDIDMVLSTAQTPYVEVCNGFCPTGTNVIDGRVHCIGDNTEFNKCLERLKPQNCVGASQPVAASGAVYYYGYRAGKRTCQASIPC